MNLERNHWLAIGIVLTGLASVVLGAATLSGFGSPSSGDLVVFATPGWSNLLLAAGALSLLVLEYAHLHRHPIRIRRAVASQATAKA